jgi:hypothetical protein
MNYLGSYHLFSTHLNDLMKSYCYLVQRKLLLPKNVKIS